jgi:hypothetical protein
MGVAVLAPLLLASCGNDDDPYDNMGPNGPTSTMSAVVSGSVWLTASRSFTYLGQVLTITGQNVAGLRVQVAMANVTSIGIYQLGPGNPNGALGNVINGSSIWASSLEGGTGSLQLTLLTPSRVSGTFSFTAVPASGGATGTQPVTGGSFDIYAG